MDAENREKIVIQKLNTYVQIVIRYRQRDKEAENYSGSLQLHVNTLMVKCDKCIASVIISITFLCIVARVLLYKFCNIVKSLKYSTHHDFWINVW